VLSASDVDQLAVLALTYPTRYDQGWHSGIPWHDFLVRPASELPDDLASAEDQLRTELAGRRLLLVAPEYLRPGLGRHRAKRDVFGSDEVEWLREWAERTGSVIGLREHPLDVSRPFARQLEGVAMDLSIHRYPMLQPVLRVADAVLTDYSGVALDFTLTNRPVVSFAPDLDAVAEMLLYDLDHVFPGPVCRTFAELADVLERIYDDEDAAHRQRYARVRKMYLGHTDDGVSSRRVVARVKATYGTAAP
jgi:CDP-glycerol glycerophosphotransferase (TagB/SpsB family)